MIIHREYIRNVVIAETCNKNFAYENKWKYDKMRSKENDTAAIFKTVVEINESDLRLYRPSRSNLEKFGIHTI